MLNTPNTLREKELREEWKKAYWSSTDDWNIDTIDTEVGIADYWLSKIQKEVEAGKAEEREIILKELNEFGYRDTTPLPEYLEMVKKGNMDDMYDLGVRHTKNDVARYLSTPTNIK